MSTRFLSDDFLLQTPFARTLYHEHAETMPIFDYHCHLPPADIAADRQFENLTQIWLYGDHYKWRAMRTNGVNERYCTGDASDEDKFMQWAATVPFTVRNPLFVWTHLELKRYFGVDTLLDPSTAKAIYDACSEKLRTPEYSVRSLLRRMRVRAVCTTDDPCDDLAHHRAIADSGFEITVAPTFRPDKAMAAEDPAAYNAYLDALAASADVDIRSYESLLDALRARHAAFHEAGCRLSDHGIETAYAEPFTESEIDAIFTKVRGGGTLSTAELLKLKSALLIEFGRMDHERGWTQQLHFGAMRNNNTRMYNHLGPDTGFDSIGDFTVGRALSRLLDALDQTDELPKTILYTLNPRDNELMATMLGNFQDGSIAGKLQFGSGWWFHDQRDGMERQMNALSNMGLLSRFVGMLTDSRSFLSYPRHEYFRRTLCKLIGQDVALGELPEDMALFGPIVEGICFNNAKDYFGIEGVEA
ncbi:MAG: glucuronate isomerase [Chitinivibrionales bacterium]|nr:glucuronate isomerase [Chitinivibrionales bacterium]